VATRSRARGNSCLVPGWLRAKGTLPALSCIPRAGRSPTNAPPPMASAPLRLQLLQRASIPFPLTRHPWGRRAPRRSPGGSPPDQAPSPSAWCWPYRLPRRNRRGPEPHCPRRRGLRGLQEAGVARPPPRAGSPPARPCTPARARHFQAHSLASPRSRFRAGLGVYWYRQLSHFLRLLAVHSETAKQVRVSFFTKNLTQVHLSIKNLLIFFVCVFS
jgi:hypothetical protein